VTDGSAAAPRGDRSFLDGGGELGTLIRAFDWSRTSLGPAEQWPRSLRTAVRIMLTSRQPMWIGWGPELTYLYNDPYKSIIGGKHPSALGKPTSEVWKEIWNEVGPRLGRVLTNNEGTYDEALLLIMERNGYPEETYYTFSYSPIPDDDGGTGGIICANTDDTDRVIRERQLALLRQLATAAADARSTDDACALSGQALSDNPHDVPFALLYLLEADGRLRLAARAGIDATHPSAPAIVEVVADRPWPFARALAAGAPLLVDTAPIGAALPSGAWDRPPHQAIVTPLARRGQSDASGLLVLGLNPYRVFDDRYRGFVELIAAQLSAGLANATAYEEERRRAQALAEIERAKTVFFSNVSHEFRTTQTHILGPLNDLRESAASPDVRAQATVIHRNALRLLRLVNTLLDFSRIEAGRAQAQYEPIDLAEYTRDLASSFRSAIERAGLRFLVDCPPLPDPVYVDRLMWEKVVLNLLSNAFKFTLDGEVEVRLRSDQHRVRLEVRDTGTGVPAEELPRLFERFHRVEGARGRTHEGTGIGLALVQELVKLHGGTVTAESALGRGTTFAVELPLGATHLPSDRVQARASATATSLGADAFVEEALRWLPADAASSVGVDAAAPASTHHTDAAVERILLVDDNADARDYIRRLLQPRWMVDAVGNGREALMSIARDRPDLVLTDLMMPEMDGFALMQALRGDAQTRDIPIVVLSARAGEEATLEGLQAGADDYLVKPFSARELIARVEAQLLRARIRAVEEAHARRLASVFEQAPVAVALLRGPNHVFEVANPSYCAIVNDRPLVGKPVREALPEVESQGIIAILDRVYETGEPYVGRSLPLVVHRGPGGAPETCFFDFVYQPLVNERGEAEGIAAVVYDVTELSRARREAEVASRAKDEFLAMLGHELRNPLAPILTALQLLKLRGVEAAEKERRVIERQVRHLVTLVDDLLDVSRITRGKVQLRIAPTELSAVVAKAIETASPLLEQNHHELQVDVPRRGLLVEADLERLAQVISNLLTNAAKYTNPGGRVTVRGEVDGGMVALSVTDTGIGIEPEMIGRVFDLFVQEPQAIDRAHGGLGLGLAIVRSLVQMHGGTVAAASAGRGQGTTFTVRLPLSRVTAPAHEPEAAPPEAAIVPGRRRVLVVDDNEDAAAMLAEALTAYGYVVRCAHDAPAGLEVADKFRPDVALLDIGLPVMDGYELARRFHADDRLRPTQLVAVTGYGQEQDRARSLDAGFAAHVVKPVDLEHLRALLDDLAQPIATPGDPVT
jgi:signal transduction histidine kinase